MKWEQFNKMDAAQQQEYVYRFHDKIPQPPLQSATMTGVVLWLVMSVFVLAIHITYTSEVLELVELRPVLLNALETFGTSIRVWALILVGYLLLWVASVTHFFYRERKWLRQNGVKNK